MTEINAAPAVEPGSGHISRRPSLMSKRARAVVRARVRDARLPLTFPHYGAEDEGYAVLLIDPRSGIAIGLHHHQDNAGEPFQENRTGLDHISFSVAGHDDLDAWASWLGQLGVENSGVVDVTEPMPDFVVVFRDPDNIQL